VSAEFSRWILWAFCGPINFGPKLKSTEEHMACWAGFRGKKTKENEDLKQISKKVFFLYSHQLKILYAFLFLNINLNVL
jgi:hypothetical protein